MLNFISGMPESPQAVFLVAATFFIFFIRLQLFIFTGTGTWDNLNLDC